MPAPFIRLILFVLAAFMLGGCSSVLMDPKGPIGLAQRDLIFTATWLMLIVVVPVFIMIVAFSWRYRANNHKATYAPNWAHSNAIEAVVWLVPVVIIVILGRITWYSTHELDPRKPIVSANAAATLNVQVIALDWKWLFIYPEQGVASVNELALPVNTPVRFSITSNSVMNSFFIPQLGSQLYSMGGMQNTLHLIASETGRYSGMSANYSGNGFSGMKFMALVQEPADFDAWVEQAKTTPQTLNWDSLQTLAATSQDHPVGYYAAVTPGLYQGILGQFMRMAPAEHLTANASEPDRSTSSATGFAAKRPTLNGPTPPPALQGTP
ncbi:MAG: ubiquinol oxidase subunit II [Neisseriaceae bacterium]|nr:ubiquinol oxidase subunit II [Neisseriaceae bacterium]MBP6861834.1 ubiquinol oxidase subunit II [Neisseriaceae bacterium]